MVSVLNFILIYIACHGRREKCWKNKDLRCVYCLDIPNPNIIEVLLISVFFFFWKAEKQNPASFAFYFLCHPKQNVESVGAFQ